MCTQYTPPILSEIFMNCLQRLRCKCNFHALKFAPEIERVGSLLIKRIRKFDAARNMLDKQLLGNFMSNTPLKGEDADLGDQSKYLALHLRFEVDMVAYSQCEFGGGEDEREELRTYRESHFPLLAERLEKSKYEPVLCFEFLVVLYDEKQSRQKKLIEAENLVYFLKVENVFLLNITFALWMQTFFTIISRHEILMIIVRPKRWKMFSNSFPLWQSNRRRRLFFQQNILHEKHFRNFFCRKEVYWIFVIVIF